MRVLFAVFPGTAHVHPVVPLAWALQNAGHEVRVAIHPDAAHLVTDAGLAAVTIGTREQLADAVAFSRDLDKLDQLDDALALDTGDSPRWEAQWLQLTRVLSVYRPVLDDLVAFARDWRPDLVVWDPFCVAAAVAARVTGAAHARFLWGQDNIGWLRAKSRSALERRGADPAEDPLTALMRPMLDPYGLKYDEELLLGQWTIDPMPRGMRLPLDLDYVPVRRIPYNGAATVPRWVHEEPARPRVCLTLGVGGRGRQLFRESGVSLTDVLETVAGLDVELVATLDASRLGPLPDNVRVVDYLPLNTLLPSCSAVIHHGGGGTFAAAVAHRVPQLVTPMPFWSEPVNARYVADHGAGLLIEPVEFTTDALRERLTRILTEPSFRAGAAALHREMLATPSPADVVPTLEKRVAATR